MTEEEILKEIFESVDNQARLRFGLIKEGCYIVPNRDQKFTFTGQRFITKGKKYKVNHVENRFHPELREFDRMTIVTESDVTGEKAYHSIFGIKKIIL